MPNVPPGAAYRGKISIKAYPTRELGELVWAYLGPRSRMPEELPQLEFALLPASHRYVIEAPAAVQLGAVGRGRTRYRAFLLPAHAGAGRLRRT